MTTITVLIPCYNGEKYLQETIDSIKRQTWPVTEIVLLDDGSTDRSVEIARSEGCVIRHWKVNMGIGMARKQGIEHMRHSDSFYFSFLSADDVWDPTFLETVMKDLQNKRPILETVAYTNWYRCRANLEPYDQFHSPEPTMENILDWAGRFNMFINFSTLLIPNAKNTLTMESVLPDFDPRLRYGEDLAWTLELLLRGWRFLLVPKPLVYYREHPGQWTAKGWDIGTKTAFYPLIASLSEAVRDKGRMTSSTP